MRELFEFKEEIQIALALLRAFLGEETMMCLMSTDLDPCASIIGIGEAINNPTHASSKMNQVGNIATFMTNDRPLSGITYVKNFYKNIKLVPEVKAQGFDLPLPFRARFWRVGGDDVVHAVHILIFGKLAVGRVI